MVRRRPDQVAPSDAVSVPDPEPDPEFDAIVQRFSEADNRQLCLTLATMIRERSTNWAERFDRWLIERNLAMQGSAKRLHKIHRKLQHEIEGLTQPPLHPAIFLAPRETSRGTLALVAERSGRRVVALAAGLDAAEIGRGQEVLLGDHLNVIVEVTPDSADRVGATAVFDRALNDRRMIVRSRDEELVLDAAQGLDVEALKSGEPLLIDRDLRLAYERVPRSEGDDLFLEETPTITFDDIGGLDDAIETLKRIVVMRLENPALAAEWGLKPPRAVLLSGPPGCGKTMLAQGFANWVAQLSSSGRSRFINVKPSAMNSMWYGQSEANYRRAFCAARAAAEAEPDVPVVVFFDEVDAVGAARGETLSRTDDRVLQSLMVELDGLESRGNVLVLAATNRADALDAALVRASRLGDLSIEVPRPGRLAARAILARHVAPTVPVVSALGRDDRGGRDDNDAVDPSARDELFDAAIAVIYRESDDNVLATLTFRDGRTQPVAPRDLISGAALQKIASSAVSRAYDRVRPGVPSGLTLEDLMTAADEEFSRAAKLLSAANCRGHLSGLSDVDVVGVAPRTPQRAPTYRYLRAQ